MSYSENFSPYIMGAAAGNFTEQPANNPVSLSENDLPEDCRLTENTNGPVAYINVFKENKVAVVDIRRGVKVFDIRVGSYPTGIDISPDQKYVYTASTMDCTLSVIRTCDNRIIKTIELNQPSFASSAPGGVKVSLDGKLVYVANRGCNNISVVDPRLGEVVTEIPLPYGCHPLVIDIAPDGERAYATLLEAGQVAVIDLHTNLPVKYLNIGSISWPTSICIAKKLPLALVSNQADDCLYAINTDLAEVADYCMAVGTNPFDVCFAPSEQRAYLASCSDNTVERVDIFLHRSDSVIEVGEGPSWLGLTRNGRFLVVANVYQGTVSILNTRLNKVTATVPVGDTPQLIAIKDGR